MSYLPLKMANCIAMWLEKIGLQSLSPIFEIKVIASYSKMQEAHLMPSLRERFTRRILVYQIV